ncbi:MAG TPA: signal peptidase I [Gammaproteobacteria bacterium]
MSNWMRFLGLALLALVLFKLVMYNFELALTLTTLASGVIWLLDKLFFEKKRLPVASAPSSKGDGEADSKGKAEPAIKEPILVEYSKAFFPVLLIVLLLRSFVVEPFRIPSGSMLPTLRVGDFILVNKFSYGLRLPVLRTRFLPLGEPERGDVVVFKYPENPRIDYIKRIIGLPGDKIAYRDKKLTINGEPVEIDFIGSYNRPTNRGGPGTFGLFVEHLPEAEHQILIHPLAPAMDFELTVDEGHYFVMGDNRDDSRDSRYWGFMPEKNLVGKAFFIWMHWDFGGGGLDLGRIGEPIR